MSNSNYYWSVYKNIEREFLTLSNAIHIDNTQLKVYSVFIADLIVRSVIEIESLSKELYKQHGGNPEPLDKSGAVRNLFFDTDCIAYLNKLWLLEQKQIYVTCANVHITNAAKTTLTPLKKAGRRQGCKWNKAYQALKHDRLNSLKEGTLENLMSAMGALYLLNLYYRDETVDFGWTYHNNFNFNAGRGSDVFSVHTFDAMQIEMTDEMDDDNIKDYTQEDFDKAVYILKYTDETFQQMHKNYCEDFKIIDANVKNNAKIRDFLAKNPGYEIKNLIELCNAAGGTALLNEVLSFNHVLGYSEGKACAILNKNTAIYPEVNCG